MTIKENGKEVELKFTARSIRLIEAEFKKPFMFLFKRLTELDKDSMPTDPLTMEEVAIILKSAITECTIERAFDLLDQNPGLGQYAVVEAIGAFNKVMIISQAGSIDPNEQAPKSGVSTGMDLRQPDTGS